MAKRKKTRTMTYGTTDVIQMIAEETGVSKKDVRAVLSCLKDCTIDILEAGDTMELRGFMKASVTDRKARTGRNPQTGEPMRIPASRGVKITAGAPLKKAVTG